MEEKIVIVLDGLYFDPEAGELHGPCGTARIEPRAAAVLAALCAAQGRVVSRSTLLDDCWGSGEGSDEALTQAIAQVRRGLAATSGGSPEVRTLAKRGYRLETSNLPVARRPVIERRAIGLNPWTFVATILATLLIAIVVYPHAIRHAVRHVMGSERSIP
jgi:DNA-binding winged helix-turn-helix (wHTH) protein